MQQRKTPVRLKLDIGSAVRSSLRVACSVRRLVVQGLAPMVF
jgi:hypothetical protein